MIRHYTICIALFPLFSRVFPLRRRGTELPGGPPPDRERAGEDSREAGSGKARLGGFPSRRPGDSPNRALCVPAAGLWMAGFPGCFTPSLICCFWRTRQLPGAGQNHQRCWRHEQAPKGGIPASGPRRRTILPSRRLPGGLLRGAPCLLSDPFFTSASLLLPFAAQAEGGALSAEPEASPTKSLPLPIGVNRPRDKQTWTKSPLP